jgi:chorismate mutase
MSETVEQLRSELDAADRRIVEALAARQEMIAKIAAAKERSNLPGRDELREHDVLAGVEGHARSLGPDSAYVAALFRDIIEHSVAAQKQRGPEVGRDRGSSPLRVGFQGGAGAEPAAVGEAVFRVEHCFRQPITVPADTPRKTSLVFATLHQKGALAICLNVLAEHDLNLTKLESRPRRDMPWEYLFYADFEGNVADDTIAAIGKLEACTSYLKVLGSYPPGLAEAALSGS